MIKIRLTCVKLSWSCTFIPDVIQNILPKFCLNYVDSPRKGTNRDWELFLCMCPRKWMWRYPWLWRLQAGEMFRSGKYSKRTHFDNTWSSYVASSPRSSVRVIKHVLCDPNILNTIVSSYSGWKATRIHCLCKLCQDCVSSIVSMTGKVHDFPGVSINATMNYEFPPARKSFHNFSHN